MDVRHIYLKLQYNRRHYFEVAGQANRSCAEALIPPPLFYYSQCTKSGGVIILQKAFITKSRFLPSPPLVIGRQKHTIHSPIGHI